MSLREVMRMSVPAIVTIDDDSAIGQALEEILGELGHEVVYCAKGAEGLARVQELQPAVVLLDVYLPGEDGLSVLREIREASPGTAVIMVSAYGEAGVVVKAMKQGASDFLTKPLDRDEVRAGGGERAGERSPPREGGRSTHA